MVTTTTRQVSVPLWRYHCRDCGVGDADTQHLAADHAIYCEVCLEDEGRYVRLVRWPEA